ncbi:uncharacterized protein RSE6_08882 [Rhynchosporium secalis]|uniref:Uncharacterized protein n=1 Tax=Rhynchosporium secalis TaxID=38038 RepID=A0A1E1MHM0_RHYSE|nr:uncharacterized protein RSE6_08882 [Rhynchosporium secalis]
MSSTLTHLFQLLILFLDPHKLLHFPTLSPSFDAPKIYQHSSECNLQPPVSHPRLSGSSLSKQANPSVFNCSSKPSIMSLLTTSSPDIPGGFPSVMKSITPPSALRSPLDFLLSYPSRMQ